MYLVIYSRTWQVKALATQVCVVFVWCPSGSGQLPCLMSWFNLFVFTVLLLGLFDFRRGRHISQLFSVPFVGLIPTAMWASVPFLTAVPATGQSGVTA